MPYDSDALERGIEKCRKNIAIFESAIDKERETIKEYRRIIELNEKAEIERKRMEKMIVVDAEG